jgi:hypothetical protein
MSTTQCSLYSTFAAKCRLNPPDHALSTLVLVKSNKIAFRVEKRPATHKTPPFVDFDENSVMSFLIQIFRRLNAPFTLFYTPNVVHAAFSVETDSAIRKTQPFVDSDENSVMSFLIETFRSLPHFSLHSARRTYWRPLSASKQAIQLA